MKKYIAQPFRTSKKLWIPLIFKDFVRSFRGSLIGIFFFFFQFRGEQDLSDTVHGKANVEKYKLEAEISPI